MELVIFDLDGTLLNTVADLATATNHALELCGFPTHATDEYRFFVGNGITKLFERALPEDARTLENVEHVRSHFMPYYTRHNADQTEPYPGIVELLTKLQEQHIRLAVASNKYQMATSKLVLHYFHGIHFSGILGQREGVPTKPAPDIVKSLLTLAKADKAKTLYVGDSAVDMQTAHNAEIAAVGVTWGFRPRTELEAEHPEYIIDAPADLLRIISEK